MDIGLDIAIAGAVIAYVGWLCLDDLRRPARQVPVPPGECRFGCGRPATGSDDCCDDHARII